MIGKRNKKEEPDAAVRIGENASAAAPHTSDTGGNASAAAPHAPDTGGNASAAAPHAPDTGGNVSAADLHTSDTGEIASAPGADGKASAVGTPEIDGHESTLDAGGAPELNAGLQDVIASYWKENQAPGYRGYAAKAESVSGQTSRAERQKPQETAAKPLAEKAAESPAERTEVAKAAEPSEESAAAKAAEPPVGKTAAEEAPKAVTAAAEKAKTEKTVKAAETAAAAGVAAAAGQMSAEAEERAPAETPEKLPERPVETDILNDPEVEVLDISEAKAAEIAAAKSRRMPKKKKKKKSLPAKIAIAICAFLGLFIVTMAVVLFALRYNGKNQLASAVADEEITGVDDAELSEDGKKVVYKGETYRYNENITTILCIGVDREEYNDSGEYGEGGQADTIFIVAIDSDTGKTTMIPISRNTMVEIDEYRSDGTYWRQNEIQITLAYTYGDGREESCENVARAVSRLLYGMSVNTYAAIDLSAIAPLNDAVGGVEVTVLEDLSDGLTTGETVTLTGDQAVTYVRSRKSEGTDLEVDNNVARMERQKQYVNAFLKTALSQTKSDPTLPVSLFNSVKDDMITDLTVSEVTYYASLLVTKGLDNSIVSIPGEAKKGEYTEVYVDDEALYEIVLDTFYEKINE